MAAGAAPIDKGMAGPGLLGYMITSKFADVLPLYRLENIFARSGFEIDRATMCDWAGDVADLVKPLYDRMVQRVLASHVIHTDDTVMGASRNPKVRRLFHDLIHGIRIQLSSSAIAFSPLDGKFSSAPIDQSRNGSGGLSRALKITRTPVWT